MASIKFKAGKTYAAESIVGDTLKMHVVKREKVSKNMDRILMSWGEHDAEWFLVTKSLVERLRPSGNFIAFTADRLSA